MGFIIIFKRLDYIFLATLTALLVFLILVSSSNISILGSILFDNTFSVSTKINILANIPYGYISEFSLRSLTTILFSLLSGINLAGIVYYVRLYRAAALSAIAALGSGSILSAIMGVSCISCGSLIAAFLASFFGTASLAIVLPFGGTELSIISIAFLLISIILTDKKIRQAWL